MDFANVLSVSANPTNLLYGDYSTNRSALIETKIDNKTNDKLNLNLEWTGNIFNQFKEKEDGKVYDLGQSLEATENGVQVNFSEIRETFKYLSTKEVKFVVNYKGNVDTKVDTNSYTTKLNDVVTIEKDHSFKTHSTQTYTFTKEELNNEQAKIQDIFANPEKHFEDNNTRWQEYLDKTFANVQNKVDQKYKNAAVKSIETLTTNWRSPAGELLHELNNTKEDIILAAAWESGMDNAPRFDVEGYGENDTGVDVFENKDKNGKIIGYSINQESVNLNAYLYAEKGFLKSMAEELGNKNDAKKYEKEAKYVREYVSDKMFDDETGFFYDLQINEDGSQKKLLVNRGKGPEGWIPLWAKMATKKEADKVIANMLDESKFNTNVPFGTTSQDNPSFNASKYWRGPVWLDQALYGGESLQNYGYYDKAVEMSKKMFDNAEGLLGDGPIRENYNQLTGEGLHTKNFSWLASAYYLMYQNRLEGNETTSQQGFEIPSNNKSIIVYGTLAVIGAIAIGVGVS